MGPHTLVVFAAIALALGAGLWIAMLDASPRTIALIAIGLLSILWALPAAIERITGRKIWRYSAPYPETKARHG